MATHAMHAARTRDVHVVPTPLLGGLAMYGGLAAQACSSPISSPTCARRSLPRGPFPGLLMAGGLLVVTGIIDDRWGMGAIGHFAAQVAAGAILVWSQVVLSWVPEPSGGVFILPPQLGLTLTILLVVITINAVNFIDGLDGLAARDRLPSRPARSSSTPTRSPGSSASTPSPSRRWWPRCWAGMCIGFLPHNFYPARIFMGDTGAMLIGMLLAYVPLSSTGDARPQRATPLQPHGQRVPDRAPDPAAGGHPGHPVRRLADGGRAADQGGHVTVCGG